MRNRKAWSEAEDETVKQNAAEMTSCQLAELLGRSSDAVKHRARKLNISLRKHGDACSWAKYSNELVDEARDLHESGMGPKEISIRLKIPYWNVCDFVYYKRGLGYGYKTA
jgi:hypothetical protein